MNQIKNLEHITKPNGISGGYSFRKKVEHDPDGDVYVIQMRDLNDAYTRIEPTMARVSGNMIKSKYHLRPQDILFVAKGANNYTLVYDLDLPVAVASSAFFVIRVDPGIADPYFVSWYINQQSVQQYLKENMAGTYIPNININTVKQMKINLPPLDKQHKIATFSRLVEKEQELMTAIMEKRKLFFQTLLRNRIK